MCSVRQGLPLKTQGWDAAGFRQGSLSRKQRTAKKHIYKAGWENCSGFHLIPFRAFLNYCLLFTKKVQVWCYSPYTHTDAWICLYQAQTCQVQGQIQEDRGRWLCLDVTSDFSPFSTMLHILLLFSYTAEWFLQQKDGINVFFSPRNNIFSSLIKC